MQVEDCAPKAKVIEELSVELGRLFGLKESGSGGFFCEILRQDWKERVCIFAISEHSSSW